MSLFLEPLAAGNAVRGTVTLAPGRVCRVLRKPADSFDGPDDPAALRVYEGTAGTFLDFDGLANGQPYIYRPYYLRGIDWVEGTSAVVVPIAAAIPWSADPLTLVRDRLDLALQAIVAAGDLHHPSGRFDVLTAPPQWETVAWPLVTAQLISDAPGERGIGEFGELAEGWFSRVQLHVIGWSLNPDERLKLRVALKHAVLANLPIFESAGLQQIEMQQQDAEDFNSYSAPVYQSTMTLSLLAPSWIEDGSVRPLAADISMNPSFP